MISIVYASTTKQPMPEAELLDILKVARENNTKNNITGFLLYINCAFLQILEGEENDVMATFNTIRRDPRHGGVIEIENKEITTRTFPDWSMGFQYFSDPEELPVEGFSEIFTKNLPPEKITTHQNDLVDLIYYFKKGNE